jgi:AraC-like DNA-binding protein
VSMALRKPRTERSMGLSDNELAEALGISLKRLVDAFNEAGLCRCAGKVTRQQAKAKRAASAPQGSLRTQREGRSRARCAGTALPIPTVGVILPPFAQKCGLQLQLH